MTEAEQFRITPWPHEPLPPPLVERVEHVGVDGDGWLYPDDYEPAAPLPDELVLRDLLDVDVEDIHAVAAFTAEHGIITTPAATMLSSPQPSRTDRPWPTALHISEMSAYLRWSQGMTLHLAAWLDGARVMSAWEQVGIADPAVRMRDDVEQDMAWAWFVGTLNSGLSSLHPYVESWTRLPLTDGEPITYGEPSVDLFTGMAAQVFNIAVEGLPVRTCANETCRRRFVRQLGRALKGQNRTSGVLLFCSNSCAKAQVQREYRRRNRRQKP